MPQKPVTVWGHDVGTWHYNCHTGLDTVTLHAPLAMLTGELDVKLPADWVPWIADAFTENKGNDAQKRQAKSNVDTLKTHIDGVKKAAGNGANLSLGMTLSIEMIYQRPPCIETSTKYCAGVGYQYLLKVEAFMVAGATAGKAGTHVAIGGVLEIALASDFVECDCSGGEVSVTAGTDKPTEH